MKPTKPQQTAKPTIRFSAKFIVVGSPTFLPFPKTASAKLPSRGAVMVEGAINFFPFRASLEPDGNGGHQLKVSKAMRAAIYATELDKVAVEITRVGDEPETRVPMDLRKALAAAPGSRAQASWADITPLARRDWIFSISTARQPETRKRRIAKAVDMLKSGKRRLCCFPGIKWLMKKNAKSCGMWMPLAGKKK